MSDSPMPHRPAADQRKQYERGEGQRATEHLTLDRSFSERSAPPQPMLERPLSERSALPQPMPDHPSSDQCATEHLTTGRPLSERSAPPQPMPDRPLSGQRATEHPMPDRPLSDQRMPHHSMPSHRYRPIRKDLIDQFQAAEAEGRCLVAHTDTEARRLQNAVKRGQLSSPAPEVYVRSEHWNTLKAAQRHLQLMQALAELHPDWTFCAASAALAHGLAVSNQLIRHVHVATSRSVHSRSSRVIIRHVVEGDNPICINGIRVTSLARSVFDAVRTSDFRSGLALCDSALRVGGLTREELSAAFEDMDYRLRGKAFACAIAKLADPRPESGGESIARAVMMELGVMPPDLQVSVGDLVDGLTDYRADYCWKLPDDTMVLGELDGREKYRNPAMTGGRDVIDVLTDERLRESRMSASGAKIMRFSYAEATDPKRFAHLMKAFGIPFGYPIPEVARAK